MRGIIFSWHIPAWVGILAVILLATNKPCLAGAWPVPRGTTLAIIDFQTSNSNEQYGPSGKLVSRRGYQKIEIAPYIEHGLSDELTLIGRANLLKQSIEIPGSVKASTTINEVEAGFRYHVYTLSDMLFSLQSGLILHTARQGDDAYDSQSGDLDKKFGVLLGRSSTIFGIPSFNSLETSYIFHDHTKPDEVKTDAVLGFGLGEGTLLMIKSLNSFSVGTTPAMPSNINSSKIGVQLMERVHPLLSMGGAITQTIAGQNTTRETLFSISLWYHL